MQPEPTWPGTLDRSALKEAVVRDGDALADAARDDDWSEVLRLLDGSRWLQVNQFRVGGTSWFTPLHQAAWLGAPVSIVAELLTRGAWLSLRDAKGRRPVDIAEERGHAHLLDALRPRMVSGGSFEAWDGHLRELVEGRIRPQLTVNLRHVQTEVLAEEGVDKLWFPVPGMYGGFSLVISRSRLHVESWCRVVGGSGQAHVITEHGAVLVDEGFV